MGWAEAVWLREGGARMFHGTVRWVESLGPWGPLAYVLVYALACVCLIPGSILTLGAGLLFGVVRGSIVVSVASTSGACVSFLIGRHWARRWVERTFGADATFRSIDEAVAREGWKIVALTRLSPVFPFTWINYAYGATRVSFRDYALASWIAMLPATVLYVYLGSLARDVADLRTLRHERTPGGWALYGVGFAATAALAWLAARIARDALSRRTGD